MNSAAVVQAAFDEEMLENGRNSALVELAEDHVARAARNRAPSVDGSAARAVHDQIQEELTRNRAQELADTAARRSCRARAGGDPCGRSRRARGGIWHAPVSVERTERRRFRPKSWPRHSVCRSRCPEPSSTRTVSLANGNHAVLAVANVQPGAPDAVAQAERDQRQRQLADQAALAELASYAGDLRERATVRIPEEVLEPTY